MFLTCLPFLPSLRALIDRGVRKQHRPGANGTGLTGGTTVRPNLCPPLQLGAFSWVLTSERPIMKALQLVLALGSLAAAGVLALSCGSSAPVQHQLQSITLSPASADAENYANGQVQFVATGHFSTAPMTVSPLTANWGACYQFAATSAVWVTSAGLAQCARGAAGTYTVWANQPADLPPGVYNCTAETACGGGCTVQGSAQLTCP